MDTRSFDVLSRRASLLALGALGLGSLPNPSPGAAKKRKKDDSKARKRCQTQVAQCTTFVTESCGDDPDPACLAALDCCDSVGRCDFGGFLDCVLALQPK